MNIIRKYSLKSMMYDWKKSLVTLLTISLSVTIITMIFSLGIGTYNNVTENMVSRMGKANVTIFKLNYEDMERLVKDWDILETYSYQESISLTEEIEGHHFINTNLDLVHQMEGRFNNDVQIDLIEGRLPEKSNEILSLDRDNYLQNPEDTTDKRMRPYLVGEEVTDSNGNVYVVSGIVNPKTFANSYFRDYITLLLQEDSSHQGTMKIDLKFKTGSTNIYEKTIDRLEELKLSTDFVQENTTLNSILGMRSFFAMSTEKVVTMSIIGILTLIVLITMIALVYNSFESLMTSHLQEISILRSVGMTNRQLGSMLWSQTLIIMFGSLIIGIGTGYLLSTLISQTIFTQIFSIMIKEQQYIYVTPVVNLWVLIGITVVTLLLGYIPTHRISRSIYKKSAIESLNIANYNSTTKMSIHGDNIPKELAKIQIKANKNKYRGIRISLTMTIIIVASIISGFQILLNQANTYANPYSVSVMTSSIEEAINVLEDVKKEFGDDIEDSYFIAESSNYTILDSNGNNYGYVQQLNDFLSDNFEVSQPISDEVAIYILPEGSIGDTPLFYNYFSQSYYFEDKEDISYKGRTFDIPNGKMDIILNKKETNFNGKSIEVEVIDTLPSGLFVTPSRFYVPTVIMDYSTYTKYMSSSSNTNIEDSSAQLSFKSKDSLALSSYLEENEEKFPNMYNIYNEEASKKEIYVVVGAIQNLMLILSVLILIAAGLNLMSTTSTTLYLRRNEFAMMKSLGMGDKSMKQLLNWESYYIIKKVLLISLPITCILLIVLSYLVSKSSETPYIFHLNQLTGLGYGLVMSLIIYSLNIQVSYRETKNRNIIEDIRKF